MVLSLEFLIYGGWAIVFDGFSVEVCDRLSVEVCDRFSVEGGDSFSWVVWWTCD